MPLILKVWFNNTNICLLKSIETCFVRYQNCWKHNLFKFSYQYIVIITMLIIYNVTSSSIFFNFKFDSSLFGNIFQGGLILCRNHSTDLRCESFDWFLHGAGFCWRMFPSRLKLFNFFYQYRFYYCFSLNVTGLSKSSNVFFFIYPCQ